MKPISDRAAAYLARMPVSVQGQGGRAALFSAAVTLTRGFALSAEEALPLLTRWNHDCLPPWAERDLRQVLRSAATTSTRVTGYLLDKPSPSSSSSYSYSSSSSRKPAAPPSARGDKPAASAPAPLPTPAPAAEYADAERKARQRAAWPVFHPVSAAHIRIIASLREMLPDAVDLAHRWGFLKCAQADGHACFILHEGAFAQARRLDGQPFTRADGTCMKAKNLPGSEGAFIGRRWLGAAGHVLLVEGVVGLLEAAAAWALVDMQGSWSLLAATSASARFARDPALLEALQGRHVRLVPDADSTGQRAASIWLADLRHAGISADAMALPEGCKDLGALVTSATAGSAASLNELNTLFQ